MNFFGNRLGLCVSLGVGLAATAAYGQEIETFDNPNQLQTAGGNFQFTTDGGSFQKGNGATYTYGPSYYEISTNPTVKSGAYGTGYHSIYSDDKPPAGSTASNGVVDISGSSELQLDVTINGGTDAGLFVDLLDGEGDFYKYAFGYGLTGTGNAPPQEPGETITAGPSANELILDVPLATPFSDINGTGTFDFSQVVLFRIEDDPGSNPTTSLPNPSDVSFNDLSAVNTTATPEPASLGVLAVAGTLLSRRRRS